MIFVFISELFWRPKSSEGPIKKQEKANPKNANMN